MRLSYTAYGDGPPLLILHGLFGSGRNWTSIAKKLADGRRVLTVDLRNHGDSPWSGDMTYTAMAVDVLRLIEAEKLEKPVVLGHSMGGKAAMVVAMSEPDAIGSLVVADIAPVAYAHSHDSYVDAMLAIDLTAIRRRGDADAALADAVPDAGIRGFLLHNLVLDESGARWRLNLEAITENMTALTDFPIPPANDVFPGPALFVVGAKSDYVQPDHHAAIRRYFPKSSILMIADAGHWLHAEKPAEFIATVAEFLAGLTP
jgi:pimeloyl-ACP methyl ester carboxylesterase